ncbi:MAG: hypothetical protein J0H17_16850 [Rhizobiales bacterium]|nr:hypothetical protein [Hyphomicrobiales bacterium]
MGLLLIFGVAIAFPLVPQNAGDVLVARIRIEGLSSNTARGTRATSKAPQFALVLSFKVLDVMVGIAKPGDTLSAYLGDEKSQPMIPAPPRSKERDYFVVAFREANDEVLSLLGLPVDAQEYDAWYKEMSEYRRKQGDLSLRNRRQLGR